MLHKYTGLFALVLCFVCSGYAQQTDTSKANLYREILYADSVLFNAFNHCDSVTYKKYFTDDLEFYHDLGGLSVGIQIEMQEFTEMCTRGNHIRRELVKSSVEVHPIKNYGAVEIGVHHFFHTNKGEQEKPSGTYKFVQVWRKKNNQWKISRVISYGHDNMRSD